MSEQKEKNNAKTKIIIIAVIIVMLIIIGVLGVVIYQLMNKTDEKQKVERQVSEGSIVDENYDKKAAEARFTTDMNMVWTFPSGSAVSTNAQIGNSSANMYECYFEVYLDDEDQTLLYSSPVLPVGKSINKLQLDQVLPDGSYDAVCTFHLLDDENPDKELGTVSFRVSLMFIQP